MNRIVPIAIRAALLTAGAFVFVAIFTTALSRVPPANYEARDDALITLSHARNLVEYGFIGVSPSGERVEGSSAPLQFAVAAAIYAVRPFAYQTFFRWQLLLGTALFGALVAGFLSAPMPVSRDTWRMLMIAVALLVSAVVLASSRAFLLWHASGMENVYKTAAMVALLWSLDAMLRLGRIRPFAVAIVTLAALTRIDAIVTVGPLLAAFTVLWWARNRDARGLVFAVASLAPWLLFMAWRHWYFGQWDPNTAAAQRIDAGARIAALAHAPGAAVDDTWQWLVNVGPSLHVFQFLGLPIALWLARGSPAARARAVLVLVAAVSCVAQYTLLGGVRLDPARTVTELAAYATLATPLVLLAREHLELRDAIAGIALTAAFVAVAAVRSPDRSEIGWGTGWFEVNADKMEAIARQEGIPRPLVANADLGAISWRKTANVLDLGLLGSVLPPRLDRPETYVLTIAKPDVIELHDAWSCVYGAMFARQEFVAEYEAVAAERTPWLRANCTGAPNAATGFWIRKAVKRASGSAERRFIEEFERALDVSTLDQELSRCLPSPGPQPCGHVARTVFRFAPDLRRAGRLDAVKARLAQDPKLRLEHAYVSSSADPRWWKTLAAALQPPVATPARLSFFATADGGRSSHGAVVVRDPLRLGWRAVAATDLFDVRPDQGRGTAAVELVARRSAANTDSVVAVRLFAGEETTSAGELSVRFRSFAAIDSGPPAGAIDVPADSVRLSDKPVTFQGWAVDSFDLQRVFVTYDDGKGRTIELGDAERGGPRPDVAAILPNAHDLYNAGWTFVLDPRQLDGVKLPVTLHFQAKGVRRVAEIGVRTIVSR